MHEGFVGFHGNLGKMHFHSRRGFEIKNKDRQTTQVTQDLKLLRINPLNIKQLNLKLFDIKQLDLKLFDIKQLDIKLLDIKHQIQNHWI